MDPLRIAFFAAFWVLVFALLAQFAAVRRRLDRLARIEAKLDALMRHAGVSYEPYRNLPPGVGEAVQQGDKILAITRYRERVASA